MRGLERATLAAALLLAGAPGSALATDASVQAQPSSTWSPKDVTINVGEQVTFTNAGGYHDVQFDDAAFKAPPAPSFAAWTASRRFDQPGTFGFFCSIHKDRGMVGTVTVVAAPTPEATAFDASVTSVSKGKVKLAINASGATTVTGTLDRKDKAGHYRRFGAVRFDVAAGPTTVTLTKTTKGKRLTRGAYRLKLSALARTSTVRFKVR